MSNHFGLFGLREEKREFLQEKLQEERVDESTVNVGLVGIEVAEITSDEGVAIMGVDPGSPADKAGLEVGDIIIEVNRRSIRDLNDFQEVVDRIVPGEVMLLRVNRGSEAWFYVLSTNHR